MASLLRRSWSRRGPAAFASAVLLATSALATPSFGQEPTLPIGRWSVDGRGLGWSTRLEALEIREATRAGEAVAVGFERDGEGRERPWGSGRVDRKAAGPPSARWFSAAWASGPNTVVIQIRPEGGGRLLALVRERSADRGVGDRVRQVVLAPAATDDERAVIDATARPHAAPGPPIRFESGNSGTARAELSGVFAAGADGADARPVALPDGFARAAFPAWSPDGRFLAFAGFDAAGRDPMIRVVPASGGRTTAIAAGSTPTWSFDGRRIAYVASGRAVDATDWAAPGRNDERIEAITLAGPRAGEVEVLARGIWPRWSPVDDRLAFVGRRDANWDVYLRSADGLGLARLTDDPALDTQPAWAADGRSIVFLSDRGNRWDLFRVDVGGRGGGVAERLTNHSRREDNPSLHPGGHLVAFVDGRGRPDASIRVLDLDRGTVRPFPERPDGDRDPAWSPDGRSIAFISRRPGPLLPPTGDRP